MLYNSSPVSEHECEGFFFYSQFNVIELSGNESVKGSLCNQKNFRELLDHVRYGNVSLQDWKLLLQRTSSRCKNIEFFTSALKLSYGNKLVAELNFESLKNLDQPIAKIMATHNKAIAAKFSSDNMEGLVPYLFLSLGSKVMLTRNLWTETGLVNGSLGTIQKILYQEVQWPPSLPVVIVVKFDT